jgi:hypothetical protein
MQAAQHERMCHKGCVTWLPLIAARPSTSHAPLPRRWHVVPSGLSYTPCALQPLPRQRASCQPRLSRPPAAPAPLPQLQLQPALKASLDRLQQADKEHGQKAYRALLAKVAWLAKGRRLQGHPNKGFLTLSPGRQGAGALQGLAFVAEVAEAGEVLGQLLWGVGLAEVEGGGGAKMVQQVLLLHDVVGAGQVSWWAAAGRWLH